MKMNPIHSCWNRAAKACLIATFAIGTLAISASAFAQDEKEDKADVPSPAKQISTLKSTLRDKVATLSEEYADATTEEAREDIVNSRRAFEKSQVDELLKITRQRKSTNRNVRDLVWFVSRTKGVARETIYNELVEQYSNSADLDDLAKALAKTGKPDEQVETWLKMLVEKSPKEKVKGAATYELVGYLEMVQTTLASTDPTDASDYLKGKTDEELTAEIDSLLKTCLDVYAETKYGRNKIGYLVETKLAQMSLQVGRVAPDIVGVDLDDVEFKLSDYRGKVVMIDFWGDW